MEGQCADDMKPLSQPDQYFLASCLLNPFSGWGIITCTMLSPSHPLQSTARAVEPCGAWESWHCSASPSHYKHLHFLYLLCSHLWHRRNWVFGKCQINETRGRKTVKVYSPTQSISSKRQPMPLSLPMSVFVKSFKITAATGIMRYF